MREYPAMLADPVQTAPTKADPAVLRSLGAASQNSILWDLDFRAAFCLEPNDENTVEFIYDQQIDVRLTAHLQNQSITVCHYQQRFGNRRIQVMTKR